jgi:hypothetical protein
MGAMTPGGAELAPTVQTGLLGALNAASPGIPLLGNFNVAVWGAFVGTVTVQQSFDGGTTWIPVNNKHTGQNITFTAPTAMQEDEVEPGVLYRLQMTAYTSGAANFRFSEGSSRGFDQRLT